MFHPMVAGVTIPGMGIFLLILAPYIDRNPSNKPEDRKFAIAVFTVLVSLVVGSGQPAGRQGASSAGRCITIAPSSGEILEARVELRPREEAGRYKEAAAPSGVWVRVQSGADGVSITFCRTNG